jgi:hypothetical protein
MMERFEQKKEVPQVNRVSGLSGDYNNVYQPFVGSYPKDSPDAPEWFFEDKKKGVMKPLKTYEERFPPAEFANVITEKNREGVEALDLEAKRVNDLFEDKVKSILEQDTSWTELQEDDRQKVKELVDALLTAADRVSRMVRGEILSTIEDEPLDVSYVEEFEDIIQLGTIDSDAKAVTIAKAMAARLHEGQGQLLKPYPADETATGHRRKRIQAVEKLILEINKDAAQNEVKQTFESGDAVRMRIFFPLFRMRLEMIRRMIRAE